MLYFDAIPAATELKNDILCPIAVAARQVEIQILPCNALPPAIPSSRGEDNYSRAYSLLALLVCEGAAAVLQVF